MNGESPDFGVAIALGNSEIGPTKGGFVGSDFGFGEFEDDEEIEEGSGGGTRMARMMAQAKRMQGGRNPMMGGPAMPGFQQKLAVPLDFDENANDDDDDV